MLILFLFFFTTTVFCASNLQSKQNNEKIVYKNGFIRNGKNKIWYVGKGKKPYFCVYDGAIFILNQDCKFEVVDLNGVLKKSCDLDGLGCCDPVIFGDRVFFLLNDQSVCCYSIDGDFVWQSDVIVIDNYVFDATLEIKDGKILVVSYVQDKVYILDIRNGELLEMIELKR